VYIEFTFAPPEFMQSLRLLLLEDSPDDEHLILKTFARENIEVIHTCIDTRNGYNQALRQNQWDIIISDYKLPGFSGIEALETLKATGMDIPFIMVSGTIGEVTAVEAMRAGADDYLMKDNLNRLVPVVERAIREAANRKEKRQAEQEIHYQAYLMDNLDEGIISIDKQFVVKTWNQGAEKIFGLTATECTGRKLTEVLDINFYGHDPQKEGFAVVQQVPTWKGEVSILTHQRRQHSVFLTIGRLDGFENFHQGFILICKDIEEIAQAQHKLIQSQAYIISAVENTADAIFALNLQHELIYFNSAYNQDFRASFGKDASTGLNLLELSGEKTRQILEANLQRVLRGEKFAYEHFVSRQDRELLTFEVSVSPIYGLEREIIGITYLHRDITEKRRVARQVQQLQSEILDNKLREQRIQSAALLQGQEQERTRLARELHDGLGQMLNVLKLNLFQQHAAPDLLRSIDEVITEVKLINNNLMPLVLQDFGLEAGLQQMINQMQSSGKAEIYYFSNLKQERLEGKLEVSIYRVLQEALTNALKYANAGHISIQLTRQPDSLLIMVEDDGRGFDLAEVEQKQEKGYGLLNMRFRIEALNGRFHIDTKPGRGCVINIILPLFTLPL
jgi:PAS domain S-box-containing protein